MILNAEEDYLSIKQKVKEFLNKTLPFLTIFDSPLFFLTLQLKQYRYGDI